MNAVSHNIFLHFLNKDTQDIFGLIQKEKKSDINKLKRGVNASILLCREYCFIPLGFYFESINTRRVILENLDFLEEGLLRICIREADINEYIEKKQSHLQAFADDISAYRAFYNKEIIEKLIDIGPSYLKRNVRVGDYCIEKWEKQHYLLYESNTGDMYNAYNRIKGIKDLFNITISINNAAIETRNGAFVWSTIYKRLKELGVSDKEIYNKLRIYFEKYYYEAYLTEYNATILYDFYILDRGNDFYLKKDYPSISNYSWFLEFVKCLGIEECLDASSEDIIALRYCPEFIKLTEMYRDICDDDSFEGVNSIRSIIANKRIADEDNINELINKVKELLKSPKIKYSGGLMENTRKIKTDVLIMIATEDEEKAILQNDTWESCSSPRGYSYYIRKEGKTFALARAIEMRGENVAVMAQHLIDFIDPKYVAMAGFCAGQKDETNLGDVIIPSNVYKYGAGKRTGRNKFKPEIDAYKLAPVWKQKVERFGDSWRDNLKIEKPIDYSFQQYIFIRDLCRSTNYSLSTDTWNNKDMPDLPRIVEEYSGSNDIEIIYNRESEFPTISLTDVGEKNFKEKLFQEYWQGYQEPVPATKVGVLATGSDVQQWSGIFDELSKNYDRKTIALDMEAHSIGIISAFNNKPFLIAKGVGDFAQDNKSFDNRYIEYSCYMSYRFIVEFFNSLQENEEI